MKEETQFVETQTIIIRKVPVTVVERLRNQAKDANLRGAETLLRAMAIAAAREYAYVVDGGDHFSLVSAESGAAILGSNAYYKSDDEKPEARRLAEAKASERGYLVWRHDHGEEPPPYMQEAKNEQTD